MTTKRNHARDVGDVWATEEDFNTDDIDGAEGVELGLETPERGPARAEHQRQAGRRAPPQTLHDLVFDDD